MDDTVIQVAVPVPLRQTFDYRCSEPVVPGARVLVPFGRRTLVGVVMDISANTSRYELKSPAAILDSIAVFSAQFLDFLQWAADYYHHPIGEVVSTALPGRLRNRTEFSNPLSTRVLRLAGEGTSSAEHHLPDNLNRSPAQKRGYALIAEHQPLSRQQYLELCKARQIRSPARILRALVAKQLVVQEPGPAPEFDAGCVPKGAEPPPVLYPEQAAAVAAVMDNMGSFTPMVLRGVTGSGKTEIYLHASAHCLQRGLQVLVLVPEIALTPQLVQRFASRLATEVCTLHSDMTAAQRYKSWWRAISGQADIILGTRSAIFCQLKNPGLIIVDEEHDLSFKQSEGFRYHARDLAIKRASLHNIPILLGSATPSLESMLNVQRRGFGLLTLNQRIGEAHLPSVELVDIRKQPLNHGLSPQLVDALGKTLDEREQVILYVNRRGYAPIAQCNSCGWRSTCQRCDSNLTFHLTTQTLCCHFCGKATKAPTECPKCAARISHYGVGTQRLQQVLGKMFPDARIARFDRDQLSTHHKLNQALNQVRNHDIDIIIGTQLITKGHDFPNVTLAGIINSDQGLYSADFRASEFFFQTLVQVSGRAGRHLKPGRVLIQTAHPDHPVFAYVRNNQHAEFINRCLQERQAAALPPYSCIAVFRAESVTANAGLEFLTEVKEMTGQFLLEYPQADKIVVMYPVPAPMERLAGRYRAQLLVNSSRKSDLYKIIRYCIAQIENSATKRKVRWSVDIDAMEMA